MTSMITVKGHFQPDPYVRAQKSGGARVVVCVKSLPGDDLIVAEAVGASVKVTVADAKATRRARMKAISRLLVETHRDTLAELAK